MLAVAPSRRIRTQASARTSTPFLRPRGSVRDRGSHFPSDHPHRQGGLPHHWPLATLANGHRPFCCINRYTSDTRWVKAFQSYTAKTAKNSAIQRYTLYSYTSLYTIQPLYTYHPPLVWHTRQARTNHRSLQIFHMRYVNILYALGAQQ